MPLLQDWPLQLTIEQVLQAQGVDTRVPGANVPRLIETAAQALEMGGPLVQPRVFYRRYRVKAVQHERMALSGDGAAASLSGKSIVRLLSPAKELVVMACTIGEALESFVSAILPEKPALGLALDALGSVAVQTLTEAACARFSQEAKRRDWSATVPFSPGMEGWPAGSAQLALFALLGEAALLHAQTGIRLTPAGMMRPQKSVSAVIGLGPEMDAGGRVCDYCSARQSCRYQDRYQ